MNPQLLHSQFEILEPPSSAFALMWLSHQRTSSLRSGERWDCRE